MNIDLVLNAAVATAIAFFIVLVALTVFAFTVRTIVLFRVRRAIQKRLAEMGERANFAARIASNEDREKIRTDFERTFRDLPWN